MLEVLVLIYFHQSGGCSFCFVLTLNNWHFGKDLGIYLLNVSNRRNE